MKTSTTLSIFALLTVFLTSFSYTHSNAQWQQVGGLFGEPVYVLRGTSANLYANTINGVIESTNGGSVWANEPDLYLTNTTEKISTEGDTIVVFAYPQSYLSQDNGQTWTEIDEPAGGSVAVTDMIVSESILFAATAGDFLYRSTDWGANWSQVTSGITSPFLYEVDGAGDYVFINTDDGILRSADNGLTFANSPVILPAMQFGQVYTNGTYVFASLDLSIYKSDDMGNTWVSFDSPLLYAEITDFLVDGSSVYAAGFNTLMKSDVATNSWADVVINPELDFVFSLCKVGSSLFAGTNRGVWTSADQGLTWTETNNGIIPVTVEGMAVLQNTLFAGASIYGVSYYDNNAWTYSGIPLFNCFDLVTYNTDIYSGSDYGIWKSSDAGLSWSIISPVNTPLPSTVVKIAVTDTLILGASLADGVLRSGDAGANWTIENTGMANVQISSLAISGNNIIAGSYNDGLYLSDDAGFTWSQVAGPGDLITDVVAIGNNVFASSYGVNGNFLSTDNGLTWTNVSSNVYDDLTVTGNLVIGSAGGLIEISRDSGLTFGDLTPGPAGTTIVNNTASATELFIGTNLDGVWKASISEILSAPEIAAQLESVRIIPNIFSSEATIVASSKLIESSPVLYITDISGKLVREMILVEERTLLSSQNLAPGLYFYKTGNSNSVVKAGKFIIH